MRKGSSEGGSGGRVEGKHWGRDGISEGPCVEEKKGNSDGERQEGIQGATERGAKGAVMGGGRE